MLKPLKMLKHSKSNLDSFNLQFVMKLEIYVYLHYQGGAWGVREGGFGKKIPCEEISNYLANYFMKLSCTLEIAIYRE